MEDEKHVRIAISTDASGYGWGCAVHSPSDDQILRLLESRGTCVSIFLQGKC